MAVTYEQLVSAGMTEAQARLLANEDYGKRDLTRNPMAVALVSVGFAALLGALGWLVLSVTELQTGQALLRADIASLQDGQAEIRAGVDEIRAILASRLPPER